MAPDKLCYLVTSGTSMNDHARVDWLNFRLKHGQIKRVYLKLPGDHTGAATMINIAQKISQHARPYATVRVLRDAKPRYLSLVVEHKPEDAPPPDDRRAA